jgi:hypothetical protein
LLLVAVEAEEAPAAEAGWLLRAESGVVVLADGVAAFGEAAEEAGLLAELAELAAEEFWPAFGWFCLLSMIAEG